MLDTQTSQRPASQRIAIGATANLRGRPGRIQIAFLGMLIYNLLAFVVWFLYSYLMPSQCVVQPLCHFDHFSWFPQLALILTSIACVWLIAVGGMWIASRIGVGTALARAVNSWAAFGELQRPLRILTVILAVLLVAVLVTGHASLPLVIFVVGNTALLFLAARAGMMANAALRQPAPHRTTSPNATATLLRPQAGHAATQGPASTPANVTNGATTSPTSATDTANANDATNASYTTTGATTSGDIRPPAF